MTLDEKRIKFAEWMGWKPETRKMYGGVPNVKGYGRNQHLGIGDKGREFVPESLMLTIRPKYDEDLNAMAEAVKKLSDKFYTDANGMLWNEHCEFGVQLERVVLRDNPKATNFDIYTATTLQRFEAVGRAVGLWEAEK